jgi:SAM-dependent methyltransferase
VTTKPYEYLLGDDEPEALRLEAQAALWDPTAHAFFGRLGVAPGWRVLEVGPGRGSLHLELRRRVRGPVDAVERSAAFRDRLAILTERDGLGPGRVYASDLIDAPLPANSYDLVFVRWVFLFLPDPQAHVDHLVRSLKPGGVLAVEDYVRETFVMVPSLPHWRDFIAADQAWFATQGGNISAGALMPGLMRAAGLDVIDVTPTIRHGHPGSPTWEWLSRFFLEKLPEYGQVPPLTPDHATELEVAWRAAAEDPSHLVIAPALLDVAGRKA